MSELSLGPRKHLTPELVAQLCDVLSSTRPRRAKHFTEREIKNSWARIFQRANSVPRLCFLRSKGAEELL